MTFSAPIGVAAEDLTIKMNDKFFSKFADVVSDDKRGDLIPNILKGNFTGIMNFEAIITYTAKKMCDECDVAVWDFAETKNRKGVIMYPAEDKSFFVCNANNYSESRVDSRIFGIMISMLAINHASWHFHSKDESLSQTFAEIYYAIREAFYQSVDDLAYDSESDATEEDKEQIRAMSQAVTAFLD